MREDVKDLELEESESKQPSLWEIFSITAKIGGVTLGGGYAMIPIIREEFTQKRSFLTDEEFTTLLVIAQSLPGPIAVNTSTLVGYKLRKLPGTICAVLGSIFFPTMIILAIAMVIGQYYEVFKPFLSGMKTPLFSVLLITVLRMWKTDVRTWEDIIIFAVTFSIVSFLKFNPVVVILLGLVYGVIRSTLFKSERKNGK
ncbi:MAG TPA: chromate transporter [Fervidobacterium sp.]|nr:chromate transporter [Fervidobacterium sp.]HOM74389.1 chromate transporter [Fervidobacterium sp.]HPZ17847.1 chromate transporter [Fervidobacterium sp.]HQE48869.1 chromate transporter [Fervidobacterium sp.]HRD20023.1 chromate transporter [Fervidobacterium sp.]